MSISSNQPSLNEDVSFLTTVTQGLRNQIAGLQEEVRKAQEELQKVNTAKRNLPVYTGRETENLDRIKTFEAQCKATELQTIKNILQTQKKNKQRELQQKNQALQTARSDLAIVIQTFKDSIKATNDALTGAVKIINGNVANDKPGCKDNIPKFVDLVKDIITERQKYLDDGTLTIAFENDPIPGLALELTESNGMLNVRPLDADIGVPLQIPILNTDNNRIQMKNPSQVNPQDQSGDGSGSITSEQSKSRDIGQSRDRSGGGK